MAKKINCKDGLNHTQELEARKIRRKLLEKDEATIKLVVQKYLWWFNNGKKKTYFMFWLSGADKVMYSALSRMNNWQQLVFGKTLENIDVA